MFENFTATFSHSDALGGTETSLISSVQTHTLIHAGDFNYPDSTGAIDYLVDDIPNPEQPARHDLLLGRDDRPGQHRDQRDLQPGRSERRS